MLIFERNETVCKLGKSRHAQTTPSSTSPSTHTHPAYPYPLPRVNLEEGVPLLSNGELPFHCADPHVALVKGVHQRALQGEGTGGQMGEGAPE
jgi:hypothetical protein